VYNVEGAFFATSGTCPHAGGPIGDGAMQGSVVTCPYHGWAFDVRDGRCAVDPSVKLPTFETRVVAGEICVRA
jgi:nitrite reductase/ring-hydroxylating ferredoxin subunit